MRTIVFGGSILTLLTVAKGLFPSSLWFLPLGGSSVAEMGIVFGICVAISTIAELIGERRGKNENNDNSRS